MRGRAQRTKRFVQQGSDGEQPNFRNRNRSHPNKTQLQHSTTNSQAALHHNLDTTSLFGYQVLKVDHIA